MIISKKRFEQEITKAVEKERNEMEHHRWQESRFNDMDRARWDIDRRLSRIEQKLFPEEFQNGCIR